MLRITSSFGSSCFGGCTGACCFLLFFCFLELPKSLLRLLRRLFLPPRLSFRLSLRLLRPPRLSFRLLFLPSPRFSLRPLRLSLLRLLFLPSPRLSLQLLFLSPRLSFLLPRLSLLRLSLLPRLLPDSFFWNFAFNLSTCSSDTVLI